QWHTTRDGHTWGATGLHRKGGQLAPFAPLRLQRGEHAGAQLLPAAWGEATHATSASIGTGGPEPESARCGCGVWPRTPHGAWRAPAAGVEAMHATRGWIAPGDPEPESARYGYGVGQCTPDGAWRADGALGQLLIVLPEQDAAVTVTSRLEGRGAAEILRAVWEELLPLL